ncbi:hypothetical protein GGR56DRAFT_638782 [Xylariaceae sp. FL0804]|nr:hypothetical protein GGR56DRAFT_638782 [Xylariaceae sp. FL0804]
MPSVALEYPTKPYSKVRRYDARASYALRTIHQIVNTCPILHVSFSDSDSPFPMMLPMIGQMGSFARPSADEGDVLDLYLHGYVSSRIMNLSRSRRRRRQAQGREGDDLETTPMEAAGAEGDDEEEEGLPVTVGATHADGLVLSLTPNSHSYNYRSAVLFGRARPVTDVDEKLYAMRLITDGVVRGRWANTRVPPNGAEMQSTSVLRVTITTGSAKIRSGLPSDEKADLEDAALLGRVWTGVVPMRYAMETPVPGAYNRLEKVPAYLDEWREEYNKDAKDMAVESATRPMGGKKK